MEVPETSENPTQSIHNIIRRRTQLLAVILYKIDIYILYYILYYLDIELDMRHHSGLQGVTTLEILALAKFEFTQRVTLVSSNLLIKSSCFSNLNQSHWCI